DMAGHGRSGLHRCARRARPAAGRRARGGARRPVDGAERPGRPGCRVRAGQRARPGPGPQDPARARRHRRGAHRRQEAGRRVDGRPAALLPGERRGHRRPARGVPGQGRRQGGVLLERGDVRPARRRAGRRGHPGRPAVAVRREQAHRRVGPAALRARLRHALDAAALLQRGRGGHTRARRHRGLQPHPDGLRAARGGGAAAGVRRRLPDARRHLHPRLRPRRRHRRRPPGGGPGAGGRPAGRDLQHRPRRGQLGPRRPAGGRRGHRPGHHPRHRRAPCRRPRPRRRQGRPHPRGAGLLGPARPAVDGRVGLGGLAAAAPV
ncbi:MAG: UDP-glucose 4-epimerase, partial [uncultured Frankineae bacterium]